MVGGEPAGWIRPVSDREHEEVSEYERQYEDGSDPQVLDVIDIPMREARPRGFQQENWLIEPGEYWVRVGRFSWTDLGSLTDSSGTLWLDGHHTKNGENDYIPLDQAATSSAVSRQASSSVGGGMPCGLPTRSLSEHTLHIRMATTEPARAF
jgi:hypothetical protein